MQSEVWPAQLGLWRLPRRQALSEAAWPMAHVVRQAHFVTPLAVEWLRVPWSPESLAGAEAGQWSVVPVRDLRQQVAAPAWSVLL